jgi:hypothetical protein
MPNRIIRDSILDSDRYRELGAVEARLLFLEMLLLADDYGLLPVGAGFLSRRTTAGYGKSPEAIAGLIGAMVDRDLIRTYSDGGRTFAYIPRFGNSPRAKRPKWPLPPEPSRSEINELSQKRIANAMRVQTYAPETETETETETEKTKEKTKPKAHDKRAPVDLPDWLRAEDWRAYVEHRQRLRKPMTPRAQALAIGGLEKLRQAGHDPKSVIEQSLLQGWQGLYPINSTGPRRMTNAEKVAEAEKLIFGESDGTAGIQAIR